MMRMTGSGEVFLADLAQDVHLLQLENEKITVNSANLLAFDADIDWDIERVKGASGMMGGGLFNTSLRGSGYVAVVSDGPPVMLDVASAATFADAQAAITWSEGVSTSVRTDFKAIKNLTGRGSGETIQALFPVLFVFLFISSMNAPRNLIGVDWFRIAATLNPVSYMIECVRSLIITGWDWQALALGFGFVIILGLVSLRLASGALRSRMART